jgi:hypothetical protein
MPNSVDLAGFIWCGVLLVVTLALPSFRGSLAGVAKALARWKILLAFILLAAWVAGEIGLGVWLSLWNGAFVTTTTIWFVVVAAWLLVSSTDVGSGEHYLTKRALAAFAPATLFGVFLSLAPPNLIVELVLQPIIVLLLACLFLAQRRKDDATVRNVLAVVIACFFVVLVGSVAGTLYQERQTVDWGQVWRQFALPVWLYIGALPFVYAAGVVASYGHALTMVKLFGKKSRAERFLPALALVWSFSLAGRQVTLFVRNAGFEFARARGFRGARQMVKDYRRGKADDDASAD